MTCFYLQVAKTLLEECGVDPDCVDYEGWTPLHAAALWGQKEATALLLKYGADPVLKNYSVSTDTIYWLYCRITVMHYISGGLTNNQWSTLVLDREIWKF